MIIAVSVPQWKKLVEATGTQAEMVALEAETGLDFTREEDRYAARDAIAGPLGGWCAAHTLEEIRTVFDARNVCWGPYQTFGQMVADDPRASTANPLFAEIDQPGIGTYLAPGSPHKFGAFEREHLRAPVLGEHTNEILSGELGLSDGEIGKLHDAGVIAGMDAGMGT